MSIYGVFMAISPQLRDKLTVSSGVVGLDDILRGGFSPDCLYLVNGTPGTGKTTLGLQFLLEGIRKEESCLYVTLSESRREIETVAKSHSWNFGALQIYELGVSEKNLSADSQLTVFNASELELGETTEALIDRIRECKPDRVVIDSLSELRLIAQNPLRFRRQVLALKQFFGGMNCTVLLLDDLSAEHGHLESIAHGVITLEQLANQYGAERRRLRVMKMRGVPFRGGYHDLTIRKGGLDVFPRLVAAEHHSEFIEADLSSGIPQLDSLLGGGLPSGTSTLLLGTCWNE